MQETTHRANPQAPPPWPESQIENTWSGAFKESSQGTEDGALDSHTWRNTVPKAQPSVLPPAPPPPQRLKHLPEPGDKGGEKDRAGDKDKGATAAASVSTVGTQRNQTSAPSAHLPRGHPTQDGSFLADPSSSLLPISLLTHPVPGVPWPAPRPRWASLTCGSARGRWAPAGPGSGPGSGRAGALLACGRAPCPRGPGRVARRGCPCTGSPGGPWAPPGGASGLQTASRGAGGGAGAGAEVKQKTGARPSDQGPGSRRGEPRLSHPKPPGR